MIDDANALISGGDVRVVAQPVEPLRPVCLRIDRLKHRMLDILPMLRTVRLRVYVRSGHRLPRARQPAERPEVRQRVGIDIGRLGEDVGWGSLWLSEDESFRFWGFP